MEQRAKEMSEAGIFYKTEKYCKKKKANNKPAQLDNIENVERGEI